MTPITPKPWYKSTTLWLNAAAIAIVALQYTVDAKIVTDPIVSVVIISLINILLRFKTSQPLTK